MSEDYKFGSYGQNYVVQGKSPTALQMELDKSKKPWTEPRQPKADRISNRVLRLAGHNGHRLRGTSRPAR